ncbi:LysE family transporter [Pseudoteredinibacter isoporae]|uniref:Threonine/homoserine/homoserine lactone efflux protein n=1 Tax=Pseudoteredinibacter isoporae TaxID=570281 RepID=A0A7X0MW32_9GAMM|nr:threonine/homoserine/homoserine lactone efflux protein [Pseudoteredinibacter isoporae]NHO87554.1 LysE family translocator [Pseudoteredinibacter isoporae]NIB24115.1 LysE family translocator [Pseudoteredinibacter isoporae]
MISIEFLITSLVVVLIPGTGVLYTVASGLFIGKRASLYAAIGCTFGIVPPLLASVFGLAAIFHTSALAFQFVKYLGAAYLLYLAWSMWRSSSPLAIESDQTELSARSIMLKGFLINILNPKLSIFFLAFLPQFVSPNVAQPLVSMFALGLVFMLMTFLVFVLYGFMAGSFSAFIVRSQKASMAIQKVFAGSFAALGLKLAFTER